MPPADSPTAIDDLEVQCLLHVFSHLAAAECAKAMVVQKLWAATLADELLWREHLQRDFACSSACRPGGTSASTSRHAYAAWASTFCGVLGPLFTRACRCWSDLLEWLQQHAPEIAASIRPGASEEEVTDAEAALGHELPPSLRMLYRLHDGQSLWWDTQVDQRHASSDTDPQPLQWHASMFHGVLGSYSFYHHSISMRLMPLKRVVRWTNHMRRHLLREHADRTILVAASYRFDKLLLMDLESEGLYVATPGCARLITRAAPASTGEGPSDDIIRWLEEYMHRLQNGTYQVCNIGAEHMPGGVARGISLFPAARAGGMAVAVTRGVRVCVSCLMAPELYQANHLTFAYSVRFALLTREQEAAEAEAEALHAAQQQSQQQQQQGQQQRQEQQQCGGVASSRPESRRNSSNGPGGVLDGGSSSGRPSMESCQLLSRHWVIRDAQGDVVDEVSGEAVVGKYPLLRPNAPEFVYQSCTHQQEDEGGGSMEGHFAFVEGSMRSSLGPPFDVLCPRFHLQKPDYVY